MLQKVVFLNHEMLEFLSNELDILAPAQNLSSLCLVTVNATPVSSPPFLLLGFHGDSPSPSLEPANSYSEVPGALRRLIAGMQQHIAIIAGLFAMHVVLKRD
nr:hypothetical protein Itr_chr07CG09190 [Ipomoea trifida]